LRVVPLQPHTKANSARKNGSQEYWLKIRAGWSSRVLHPQTAKPNRDRQNCNHSAAFVGRPSITTKIRIINILRELSCTWLALGNHSNQLNLQRTLTTRPALARHAEPAVWQRESFGGAVISYLSGKSVQSRYIAFAEPNCLPNWSSTVSDNLPNSGVPPAGLEVRGEKSWCLGGVKPSRDGGV